MKIHQNVLNILVINGNWNIYNQQSLQNIIVPLPYKKQQSSVNKIQYCNETNLQTNWYFSYIVSWNYWVIVS